jgi:hypothetical protein
MKRSDAYAKSTGSKAAMNYEVRLQPRALNDLEEAYLWAAKHAPESAARWVALADVVKTARRRVHRQHVFQVNIHFQQIADGVLVLDAVEPAENHTAVGGSLGRLRRCHQIAFATGSRQFEPVGGRRRGGSLLPQDRHSAKCQSTRK